MTFSLFVTRPCLFELCGSASFLYGRLFKVIGKLNSLRGRYKGRWVSTLAFVSPLLSLSKHISMAVFLASHGLNRRNGLSKYSSSQNGVYVSLIDYRSNVNVNS